MMQYSNSMYSGKDEHQLCIGVRIFTLVLVHSQLKGGGYFDIRV